MLRQASLQPKPAPTPSLSQSELIQIAGIHLWPRLHTEAQDFLKGTGRKRNLSDISGKTTKTQGGKRI